MRALVSFTIFKERYNTDLANDFGNLVNRIFILIKKFFDSKIPKPNDYDKIDLEIISSTKNTSIIINQCFEQLKIHEGLENIFVIIRSLNKFLEIKKPWENIKKNKSLSSTTLYVSAEILRIASCHIHPVMPNKTNIIVNALYKNQNCNYDTSFGILKPNTSIDIISNIFPRIE